MRLFSRKIKTPVNNYVLVYPGIGPIAEKESDADTSPVSTVPPPLSPTPSLPHTENPSTTAPAQPASARECLH